MKIDYPTEFQIDLNLPKILRVSARMAVKLLKQQWRSTVDGTGKSIPRARVVRASQPAIGRPMIRTGEAMRSIKVGKVRKNAKVIRIGPNGYHSYDGSAIPLCVNVMQKRHGLRLMSLSKDHEIEVTNAVQMEINRQLTSHEVKGVHGVQRKRKRS